MLSGPAISIALTWINAAAGKAELDGSRTRPREDLHCRWTRSHTSSGKPNTATKKTATSGTRQLKTPGGASLAPSLPLNRAIEDGGTTSNSKSLRDTFFARRMDLGWRSHLQARKAIQLLQCARRMLVRGVSADLR